MFHKCGKQRSRPIGFFIPNPPWGPKASDSIDPREVETGSDQPGSSLAADPSFDP